MKNLKSLFSFISSYKSRYVFTMIVSLLSSVCTVLCPLFLGKAINLMIYQNTDFKTLALYVVLLIVFYSLSELMNYYVNLQAGAISFKIMQDVRSQIFQKVQSMPISEIDNMSIGDFSSRMALDVENIGNGLTQGTIQFLRAFGLILGTMIVMLTLNVTIGLVVILLTPISLITTTLIAKGTQKHYLHNAENLGQLSGLSTEYITNQRAIIANSHEEIANEKFEKINDKAKTSYFYSHFYSALTNPTSRLINNFIYITVGALGVFMGITVGEISSFLIYSNHYTKPFNEITSVIGDIQKAMTSAGRVWEILAIKELPDVMSLVELDKSQSEVQFENVSFSYEKTKPLIRNFNLNVKTGEKIAIVGSTGAGKTTLINLLMRYYDADSGEISINGFDIRSIPYASLRKHISIVLQDSFIKECSVLENIAFGNKDITLEQVIDATKRAMCYDFIIRLPKGFDTIVTSKSFSKGEMQLICIARAMVENAPMLILDEATSNIDSLTEIKVQRAFNELIRGKTSFVIAHRLSTIKNSDKIIVMEKGDVVEVGTSTELLALNGKYAQLCNKQFNENES